MSPVTRVAAVAALAWGVVSQARASGEEEPHTARQKPLALGEVLASVVETHPLLEAARHDARRAKASQLAADGVWDPRVSVAARSRPVGYYEHTELDTKLRQPTPLWGAELHVGYRLGRGDYPVYKGELETLSDGELRAGLALPLWKDRAIDTRRAGVARAEQLAGMADCGLDSVRLELQRQAAYAYWRWVAAGLEVEVERELLAVARDRDAGLRDQVAAGQQSAIIVTDNARLLLERRAKLVSAERVFRKAALQLSLFLRDAELRPLLPDQSQLPERIPELNAPTLRDEHAAIERALLARPEMCALARKRAAAQVDVRLARNDVAPTLNAEAFVARDVGTGPAALAPTEFGAGLRFEMPLLLRSARGQRAAAQAEVDGLRAQERALRDEIAATVRAARVDLHVAAQQVALAGEQLRAATTLAAAERDKLAHGASDLLLVNLRELAAAEAARQQVEALAALQLAHVDYLTVTGFGLLADADASGQAPRPR